MRRLAASPRKGREWASSSGSAKQSGASLRRRLSSGAVFLAALVVVVFMCLVQTCRLGGPGFLTPILVSGDSFNLAWDPSPPVPESEVTTWRIYFRAHGTVGWAELQEMSADEGAQCTITRDELGDGDFDLAVSAVDTLGRESVPHSSTDPNAWPIGGWYIQWRG